MNAGNLEALLGVEIAILRVQPPAALRNHADAAPRAIGHFENLAQQLLRGAIALERHHAAVGVLHFVPAGLQLHHRAANPIQQIERLKARDHNGHAELLGQRRILPVAHHAAHVARGQKRLHLVARRVT